MKAAVFYAPLNIKLEETKIPEIHDNEILIKVKRVGVCPTDVRIYYNGSKFVKTPIILGHEVSGVVVKSNVKDFYPGDRVNVAADAPCLSCRECKRGLENLCTNLISLGYNVNGAYAEYMVVPSQFIKAGLVFKLPDEISFCEGAEIEPIAVSLHSLNLVKPKKDDIAVIIGEGFNALIHLQLLKYHFNVKKVIVVGITEHRLKAAEKLGADKIINAKEEFDKYLDEIKSDGIDIIDITVNNEASINEAIKLYTSGSRFTIFGGSAKEIYMNLTTNDIHYNQLLITGSSGTTTKEYQEAYKILINKEINIRDLITNFYQLDEINEALKSSAEYKGIKSMIKID